MKTLFKTTPGRWSGEAELSNPFSVFDDLLLKDFSPVFKSSLPAVNISQSPVKYELEFSAPGFSKENFKIEANEGKLTVSAEIVKQEVQEEKTYTRKEFGHSSFNRVYQLPDDVNADEISAVYENGILRVSVPKREEAKPKPAREIKVA